MLSIEEIKLTIDTLKKLKNEDFKEFIDLYLEKLEKLALQVDAYNDEQIKQYDKPLDWFEKDLNWRHNHRESIYSKLLNKQIESKIFAFAKTGAVSHLYNSLEIGPGYGRFSKMFLSWRINFFLDVLPQCESKIKKLFHPAQHKYIRFYTTEKTHCAKIPTQSCNFVFSWDTFTFFTQKHIRKYLIDLFRVILPGGYCFIHYADCHFEKDLHEAKRGYWNYNTKTEMRKIIDQCGYNIIEMDQFSPGANYAIFQKPGKDNPVVYKVIEPPADWKTIPIPPLDIPERIVPRTGKSKKYNKK
tara:strand:+ start:2185 stop:3084 length:900 start_codon:yes stop_codon:yes gene_type:complete